LRRRQRPLRPGHGDCLREALSQYDLFWYEEPGDPLDFELQATLRNYYENPMATGEDLFSMQDARNLIRYGGMRRTATGSSSTVH
jgi:L-alanine-DL-glutamate epimerase-like enolase superfamily enzyme